MTVFTATFKIKPVCYKIKVSVTYIVYVYLAGSLSNWLMFSLTFSFFGLNWKAYPKKQILNRRHICEGKVYFLCCLSKFGGTIWYRCKLIQLIGASWTQIHFLFSFFYNFLTPTSSQWGKRFCLETLIKKCCLRQDPLSLTTITNKWRQQGLLGEGSGGWYGAFVSGFQVHCLKKTPPLFAFPCLNPSSV